MADAGSGIGSHQEGRQQRTRQPKQPGASGRGGKQRSSKAEATGTAIHRRGRTGKHVSDDR